MQRYMQGVKPSELSKEFREKVQVIYSLVKQFKSKLTESCENSLGNVGFNESRIAPMKRGPKIAATDEQLLASI